MRSDWQGSLTTLVLFVLLAIVQTWPLATAPSHLSRNDNSDTVLNEWILGWVVHQAPRDPVRLFDANIFYPEKRTLAYSEPLIVPAVMGAPLFLAGASPGLTYNILLLAGLALTGWAGCRLVWRWTDDVAAGILTGAILAFNAHTLTRLPQLQGLHMEFLPLAVLAFDDVLATVRVGAAMRLALWFILQGLTSYYSLVFTTTALAVGFVVRPDAWLGTRARRVVLLLVAAGLLAGLGVAPFFAPYLKLGRVRPLDEVAYYAASWRDYLASPARVHNSLWSGRFYGGTASLFPGVTALALAAIAVGSGLPIRDRHARMAVAIAVSGGALSFGPFLPGYAALYHWLPFLQGIRNVARFGYLAILGMAILSGLVLAALRRRWKASRWTAVFTTIVIVAANVDALSIPIEYVRAQPVPALLSHLAGTNAVVAVFPFYPPDRAFHNTQYMFDSTVHWCQMLNGYSGIIPESYVAHARELGGFPDARSIAALHAFGVTRIIVRYGELADWTDNQTVEAVKQSPDLRLLEADGVVGVYGLADGR